MKRWTAIINYRTDNGVCDVRHDFEELEELDEIVERGPNFYTIENISITINPYEGVENLTIEQSEKI